YSTYGFQIPRSGNNMIGSQFFCSHCSGLTRWYPRNRLKAILEKGKTYCARYFVVNTNNSPVGIDSYSMLFGNNYLDTISQCTIPLTYLIPQIVRNGPIITDTRSEE